MRAVEYHLYWLQPTRGAKKPYLSSWKMTKEEAEKIGAIKPEPSSREVRQIAETPEEVRSQQTQAAGRDGARPPPRA